MGASAISTLVDMYQSWNTAKLMMQIQTSVLKKSMDLETNLQLQLINQLSQSALSNNPTNTGVFLNIRV